MKRLIDAAQFDQYITFRKKHIVDSYPKLLYLFSDVLIFVMEGNWKQVKLFIDPLLFWAKVAGAGVTNIAVKPKLILIFNKVSF
jgi:hypothetical protein